MNYLTENMLIAARCRTYKLNIFKRSEQENRCLLTLHDRRRPTDLNILSAAFYYANSLLYYSFLHAGWFEIKS